MSHPAFSRSYSPADHPWSALALLCVASFMVILDSSIVIVALPSIQTGLTMSPSAAQWVISAYAVTFGGLLLFGGRAADRLGRRRVFLLGVALFGLTSLACGLARSSDALIVARAAQGIAAALMLPTALSILMTTFAEGAVRNKALGVWGATAGIGGTAGSLVGGPITEWLGWQWIFLINVPVAVALLALSPLLLQRDNPDRAQRRSFDLAGAVTVTVALMALVYAVVASPSAGPGRTLAALAVAAALIVAFVLIERGSSDPLVPLRIFGSRTLVGGNLVSLAIGMAVFGAIGFTLTLYAQHVLGWSAVEFGLISSVNAAMAAAGSMVAQRIVTRTGPLAVAATSLVLLAIACLLLNAIAALSGGAPGLVVVALLIFGAGLGAGTLAGAIAALSNVSDGHSGVASGVNSAAFQVGGALGIAIISAVAAIRTGTQTTPAALTDGYRFGFAAAAAIAVLGLIAATILLRQRRSAGIADGAGDPEPLPQAVGQR